MQKFTLKHNRLLLLDRTVIALMYKFPVILAGGAARAMSFKENISDYDIFFYGIDTTFKYPAIVENAKQFLLDNRFELIFECPKGELLTFRKFKGLRKKNDIKVQFILKRSYKDAYELLDTFDFNACRFAAEFENGKSVYYTDETALTDVISKVLTIHKITYPSSSINRLYKYRNKGYYVGDAIKEIVRSVNQMTDYNEIDDQLYID